VTSQPTMKERSPVMPAKTAMAVVSNWIGFSLRGVIKFRERFYQNGMGRPQAEFRGL
jgi:hypothetical protein